MHYPVLLEEAIEGLDIKKDHLYIDATVGEGGHMVEIAKRGGKVLGIDWDYKQISNIKDQILKSENSKDIKLVIGNFAGIEKIAKENNFFPVDGVLFDLGLSINQIQESNRGFSYENLAERLDMRLNYRLKTTAADLINSLNQNQIYEILARYGEEINSRTIVQTLIRARSLRKIKTAGDLIRIIEKATGKKDRLIYARVFQALRIAVNNELENLKKGLTSALRVIKKRGRLVVISFHSLEDRIVKQFVKMNNLKQVNKKVIRSKSLSAFERSAKMRIISYEPAN